MCLLSLSLSVCVCVCVCVQTLMPMKKEGRLLTKTHEMLIDGYTYPGIRDDLFLCLMKQIKDNPNPQEVPFPALPYQTHSRSQTSTKHDKPWHTHTHTHTHMRCGAQDSWWEHG